MSSTKLRSKLKALIQADLALATEYEQITSVAKAVRVNRDFGRLLRNFVNFADFYGKQAGAFQAGTLYLDARALRLTVPVADVSKHAVLATSSDAYLVYCELKRDAKTRSIAAAITNGDAENIFVGRNGIFYDHEGADWDATITKVIANPISIREAFWTPYKKLVRVIEDNVTRRAAAADATSTDKLTAAGTATAVADNAVVPPTKKIDLGTAAAIGVAIGGIGTGRCVARDDVRARSVAATRPPRHHAADLATGDVARVAQATASKPRADPRRQRVGHQQSCADQCRVRCGDDRAREVAIA